MIKLSVWRLSRRQKHFSLILTNAFSVSGHATMRCDKLYEIRGHDIISIYATVLWSYPGSRTYNLMHLFLKVHVITPIFNNLS